MDHGGAKFKKSAFGGGEPFGIGFNHRQGQMAVIATQQGLGRCGAKNSARRNATPRIAKDRIGVGAKDLHLGDMIAGHSNAARPVVFKRQIPQFGVERPQLATGPARMQRRPKPTAVTHATNNHPPRRIPADRRHHLRRVPATFTRRQDPRLLLRRHGDGGKLAVVHRHILRAVRQGCGLRIGVCRHQERPSPHDALRRHQLPLPRLMAQRLHR